MIRHKVSYFLSIAVVLVLLFFFPKPILLAVLLLEIALPLLALVLLRMDIAAMTLSLQAPVTSNVNAPLALDITYKAKRPLFSVSAVEMTLEMQNLLFHTQEERWLRIGLSSRKSSHVEFTPDMCGEWFIRASGVQCLDVFGFCAAAVPCELFCRVKVMPEQNDITIMTDQASRAKPEVGSFRVYQKGNDTAEVFELREYQEGDELKAIHWKLTSKMDRLIVREYSDSTRYDTIVLYDIALKANGEDVDKTLLSTSHRRSGKSEPCAGACRNSAYGGVCLSEPHYFRTHCSGGRCRRVPLHAAVLSAGGEQRHRLSVFPGRADPAEL